MSEDLQVIAASFDQRAARYAKSDWHRLYAERFVELAPLEAGLRVLDAGAGTGFATLAIARRVGPTGRVLAVDVSAGMLTELRSAAATAGLSHIDVLQADATGLEALATASFDAVLCSSALLYMSAPDALREWHRLLEPGGVVGFSGMCADSPPPGRMFRDCATSFGLTLEDPSAVLGSEERCRNALRTAGFSNITVSSGEIHLSPADLENAWESNLRSAAHAPVRGLPMDDQDLFRSRYEAMLQRALLEDERAITRGDVLFAFGRK